MVAPDMLSEPIPSLVWRSVSMTSSSENSISFRTEGAKSLYCLSHGGNWLMKKVLNSCAISNVTWILFSFFLVRCLKSWNNSYSACSISSVFVWAAFSAWSFNLECIWAKNFSRFFFNSWQFSVFGCLFFPRSFFSILRELVCSCYVATSKWLFLWQFQFYCVVIKLFQTETAFSKKSSFDP